MNISIVPPSIHDILTRVLEREGWPTVTNRPADKGGLTKGGVTLSSFNSWLRLRGKAAVTPSDFPTVVTEDVAMEFMLDQIAGPLTAVFAIDTRLFSSLVDWAETSGPDDPTRALQQALRSLGHTLVVDSVFGSKTAAAVRTASTLGQMAAVRRAVAASRVEFYVSLALKDAAVTEFLANPRNSASQLHNLRGWVHRAIEFV